MKKQHLADYRLFSAIFHTQQSKNDVIGVIVTSFWIRLLLSLRDFVPYCYHAKFDGDWIRNKGETGKMCPAYMVPSLNRVNITVINLWLSFICHPGAQNLNGHFRRASYWSRSKDTLLE